MSYESDFDYDRPLPLSPLSTGTSFSSKVLSVFHVIRGSADEALRIWGESRYNLKNKVFRSAGSSKNASNKNKERLQLFGKIVAMTSAAFWFWAIYNTLKMDWKKGQKDLGIYSFFGSMLTSLLILSRWRERPNGVGAIIIFLSHLVVACNYILGLLFARHFGYIYFGTYCAVFAVGWIFVARIGWILISNVHENNRNRDGAYSRLSRDEGDDENSDSEESEGEEDQEFNFLEKYDETYSSPVSNGSSSRRGNGRFGGAY